MVVLFAMFGYAIWTQRYKLETIEERVVTFFRIGLLMIFTFLALFLLATPGTYIPVGSTGGIPDFPAFDLTKYYQYHLFLVAWYVVIGLSAVIALAYITLRETFTKLLSSMRPFQTIFFMAIVTAGLITGWKSVNGLSLITSILERPYWVNLEFVALALLSPMLAWWVSVMWNDLSDRETDLPGEKRFLLSREMKIGTFWQISLVMASVSVALAYLLSLQQSILICVILALSYMYTFPPFRFKDHVMSPLLIGLGTFLVFLFGSLTPYSQVAEYTSGGVFLPHLTGEVIFPSPGMEVFYVGFYMFIGLVVGSMITDVDGYEEDLEAGVSTVYTVLGLERGMKCLSLSILFASLTPLALFNQLPDLIFFPILGVVSSLVFLKLKGSRPIFLLALVGLAYASVRFLEISPFS